MLRSANTDEVLRFEYHGHEMNAVMTNEEFRLLCNECQKGVAYGFDESYATRFSDFQKLIRYTIISEGFHNTYCGRRASLI